MKKLIALLAALLLMVPAALAEDVDLTRMTLEELRELQARVALEIAGREAVVEPVAAVEGKTLRELFPDVNFAKAIRDVLNKFSIDMPVTQEELDSVVNLKLTREHAIQSFEGISHLRNLRTLELDSGLWSAYGAQLRVKNGAYSPYLGTTLTEEIGQLPHLTRLHIEQGLFTTLPESMRNLTNLQVLEITNSALTEFPAWLAELPNLHTISFRQTFISELPENIGSMTSLKFLTLTDTDITVLPDSICALPVLEALHLGYTALTALPENIGSISTLQKLSVDHTPLTSLPVSLFSLQLKELNIQGTAIE